MTTRTASPNGQTLTAAFAELGVPTTTHYGGGLYHEFLPQLRGAKALKAWREMSDNDATIGALLFAVEQLVRGVKWSAQPADDTEPAAEWATFLEECMDDMSHTWPDFVAEATTQIPYGWAWFETVYKRRLGEQRDGGPVPSSRYDDGRIGWRKHALRGQETLLDFDLDEHGGVQGMWQTGGTVGKARIYIPIAKSLLFRTTTARPLGKSWLRNSYRAWFFKKRAEEIAMIGADRDLGGIPTAWVPPDDILSNSDLFQAMKKIASRTKIDEQQGLTLPLAYDEMGNKLFDFQLLSPGSGRAKVDPIELVRMFALDMLGSVLAGFIALGRDAVGARALAEPQQELFRAGLEALVAMMAAVVNRHGVSRLMRLNGVPPELWPTVEPGEIKDVDLAAFGEFLKNTAAGGFPWLTGDPETDRETINQVRTVAGFDALPADTEPDVTFTATEEEDDGPVGLGKMQWLAEAGMWVPAQ